MSVQIHVACAASGNCGCPTEYPTKRPILDRLVDSSHRRSDRMKWNNLKAGVFQALWCALVVALCASSAFAQTQGRLLGTIEDAQGAVLPGVTVTVTSPQLQGANTTVTDATGQFRFPTLPPGVYHVKAELSSFKSVDQSDVRLGIDQTVTLPIKMQLAGVTEVVNVTGTTPVVDTTSSVGGVSVGQELMEQLAVRRDIYAVTRFAPGVTQDTFGPSFYGSTSAGNSSIIEGLNQTGAHHG